MVRRVAKKQEISRYPTIKYFKHGHWGKYEGLRTLEDLLEFSERLMQPASKIITEISEIVDYDVSFLLQLPSIESSNSINIINAFEDAALKLHGRNANLFTMKGVEGTEIITLSRSTSLYSLSEVHPLTPNFFYYTGCTVRKFRRASLLMKSQLLQT